MDELLYRFPIFGRHFKRLYSYFKHHIAFADLIHVVLGFGLGLLVTGSAGYGLVFVVIGILGHLYAYLMGTTE